ncbi:biotin transporter BioY [Bacillus carboniphilus]|uniref:Biotin transporter n=2 Tax=Bacillus carboniphilus TaxID=86663 RepID=A0ABY9K0S1_9BACI|nr:biotin transporter BioY [Bacillus carboniphilus]WLR44308.1 biotin transporter BioY [Bacillus carboniphilus]
MFAALMAIGANLTSWAPFLQVGGVPLSMAPFFCILAGLLLGSRLGALSMTVYMLVGIVGAPVFAQFKSGIFVIIGPTGGFIISYILTAYVSGKIVERKKEPTFPTFLIASLVGISTIYLFGTTYFWVANNVWLDFKMGYGAAWGIMSSFMIKDLAFTILGAIIAPRVFQAVKRATNYQKHHAA